MIMFRSNSLATISMDSEVFYVESSSEVGSPSRNSTPVVFNSSQLPGVIARQAITISSVTSPEPLFVTIESESGESTIPYRFGNQHPILLAGFNDLNLPPNPFNSFVTVAVIQANTTQKDENTTPHHRSRRTRRLFQHHL